MRIELPLIKGEKSMGLVPSMVLRSQSPVDNWEDWLVVEANRAKYAAAYSVFPSGASNTQTEMGFIRF
jgi:hypothetical protein